jgi:hypothetical protein
MPSTKRKVSNQHKRRPSGKSQREQGSSLQSLLATLTDQSYFDLTADDRKLLQGAHDSGKLQITGWSVVPHPKVLEALQSSTPALVRRIVTIETLQAKIYSAVRKFLLQANVNVSSYYTGGSADFICDITLSNEAYKIFYENLGKALSAAGAEKVEDIKKLVCVFRVDEALVLSRRELSGVAPAATVLKKIVTERAKFEAVCGDYRSEAAAVLFRNDQALDRYLRELMEQHAIIGFRPLLDRCRFVDRQYVPLCHGGRVLDRMLRNSRIDRSAMLKPVVELLSVRPEESADELERAVTHIFINEYALPGERLDWRSSIYEIDEGLNIFTYPIEGTINESALILSNLPEAMSYAREYSGDIDLGVLFHATSLPEPPVIRLDKSALAFQGVTLGISGSGKTNTDCVLLSEIVDKIDHIIVADSQESHSIRDKLEVLPSKVRDLIEYLKLDGATCVNEQDLQRIVDQAFLRKGISVIEAPQGFLPVLLDACLRQIEKSTHNTGNQARKVEGMLLVEEANDAFGSDDDRRQRIGYLESVLTKASRKGWCIWLSTQHPSDLGYDYDSALRILRALQNRIIHQLEPDDTKFVESLLGVEGTKNATEPDFGLTKLPKGIALVRGSRDNGGKLVLSPVMTKIRELGKDRPAKSSL